MCFGFVNYLSFSKFVGFYFFFFSIVSVYYFVVVGVKGEKIVVNFVLKCCESCCMEIY